MAAISGGRPVTNLAGMEQKLIQSAFRKAMLCERLGGPSQGQRLAELREAIELGDFMTALAVRDEIRAAANVRIGAIVCVVLALACVIAAFSYSWWWVVPALLFASGTKPD